MYWTGQSDYQCIIKNYSSKTDVYVLMVCLYLKYRLLILIIIIYECNRLDNHYPLYICVYHIGVYSTDHIVNTMTTLRTATSLVGDTPLTGNESILLLPLSKNYNIH